MALLRDTTRYVVTAAVLATLLAGCGADPRAQWQSGRRPTEARITGFAYGTLPASRGHEQSRRAAESLAISKLEAEVARARTAQSLHRLALARLAVGQYEAARLLLDEATRLRPEDATILADLAAAEMAAGQVFDSAEHSAQALERNPNEATAAFNWALALDKMHNRPGAIDAWRKYLELDPAGGWSDEARQHLARLHEPRPDWEREQKLLRSGTDASTLRRIHAQYPHYVRVHVQKELLPAWVASGRAEEMAVIRTLAEARAASGDPFLLDVVEHTAAHRADVAGAFRAYAAAVDAEKSIDSNGAAARYAEAAGLFRRADSPMAVSAEISAATNDSYVPRTDSALKRLSRVDNELAAIGNRYPGVAAQSAWIRALVLEQTGDPKGSLAAYRRARAEAKQAGEVESGVAIEALLATQVEIVGGREEADRARLAVLQRCDEIAPMPRRMYTAVAETAFCEWHANRPRLALAFLDWQGRLARQENMPLFLAECASQRAINLVEIGRIAEAEAAVREARVEARQVASGLGSRTLADVEFTTGRIEQLRGNMAGAMRGFSAALTIWTANHWHIHAAEAYLARGEAALADGNRAAAERDFRDGIAEFEGERERSEAAMRVDYFERAGRLFEDLVGLLVDSGRTDEALTFAEQKRARFLLDQVAGVRKDDDKPFDARALVAASRGRAAMLELMLLDRGTSIWLVRDGRIVYARSSAGRAEIENAVERQLAAIRGNDSATVQRLGRWLFDELVAPVSAGLPPDSDLVIVPDGALHRLPFATLVMPDGRYLIEGYTLAISPSATVFLRAAPAVPASRSILAVAQPAPPGFDPLPNSAREAQQIARLYAGGGALIGSAVTPAEFLAEAAKSSYVHFAGHATVDLRHPSKSALQFESAAEEPVTLTAEAIAATRLPARPLIFLAACSTGSGKVLRNEGIDSLAAAFLQARARGVVATLWNVDDAPSANLFRALHKNLQRGQRPADALREAQRSLIHSADAAARSPAVWGSTVVIGTL